MTPVVTSCSRPWLNRIRWRGAGLASSVPVPTWSYIPKRLLPMLPLTKPAMPPMARAIKAGGACSMSADRLTCQAMKPKRMGTIESRSVIGLRCRVSQSLRNRPQRIRLRWAPLLILSAAAAAGLVITGLGQLCSVRFPTYVDLERGRAETNQSSFAGVLVILLGSPLLLAPSMGVLVAAAILRPSWLPACILAALIYGAVLYLILLTVSARMLPDREPTMLKVLVDGR